MKFVFDTNVLVWVQAAIESHASTLYSEDLRDRQILDNLRMVNPFS